MAENTDCVVVDSSFIINVILPDELSDPRTSPYESLLTDPQTNVIAPYLLNYEVGNVLKNSILRDRYTSEETVDLMKKFLRIPITLEAPDYPTTLSLSIEHKLCYYDASYLQLSIYNQAKLLTLDNKLEKAYLKLTS